MISTAAGDIPCDRVSSRLLRLLRTAESLRLARRPLTIEEIRAVTSDPGEGSGSPSGRTFRRDLTILAVVGAVEYHRGTPRRGPSKWKWRGGLASISQSPTNEGPEHGDS